MLRELLKSDIGAMIESLRTDMNAQFEGVDAQFEGIRAQFEGVNAQFEEVRGDIAKLDAKLDRRIKTLADAIAAVDQHHRDDFARHEGRIADLEGRGQR